MSAETQQIFWHAACQRIESRKMDSFQQKQINGLYAVPLPRVSIIDMSYFCPIWSICLPAEDYYSLIWDLMEKIRAKKNTERNVFLMCGKFRHLLDLINPDESSSEDKVQLGNFDLRENWPQATWRGPTSFQNVSESEHPIAAT